MFIEYEDRDELMDELADRVAVELESIIGVRGKATIAFPGGTTPAPFLQSLSEIDLDWEKVTVLLGDERFVGEDSERSNTRLLKKNFLQNAAARAKFQPLIMNKESVEQSAMDAAIAVEAILPLDVLIVGMGEDMHTASLFPDSPDLPNALEETAPAIVVIHAENAGEPRLSLSARALRTARHKHVLIVGENKRIAYHQALKANSAHEAPIRTVLDAPNPATVHFAI